MLEGQSVMITSIVNIVKIVKIVVNLYANIVIIGSPSASVVSIFDIISYVFISYRITNNKQ